MHTQHKSSITHACNHTLYMYIDTNACMDGVDCHEPKFELEAFALTCFLFASGTVSEMSGALS